MFLLFTNTWNNNTVWNNRRIWIQRSFRIWIAWVWNSLLSVSFIIACVWKWFICISIYIHVLKQFKLFIFLIDKTVITLKNSWLCNLSEKVNWLALFILPISRILIIQLQSFCLNRVIRYFLCFQHLKLIIIILLFLI